MRVRAAWCPAHGRPEVVELRDTVVPAVGPGQVRVAVHAASVNFPDVLLVAGTYQIKVPPPFVPGSEFSGTVVEAGAQVTEFVVGDRVFGSTLVGGFAEEVVVNAAAMTAVPEGVEPGAAAAFGVAHRTAWHSLRSVAALQPGEHVVVLGAGGGVGLAAVQLGAHLGGTVTAVASSPEKLAAARQHGAANVVNHREGDLRAALKELSPVDVVIDPVGGSLSEPALRSMRFGGRFVTVGYASGEIPVSPSTWCS